MEKTRSFLVTTEKDGELSRSLTEKKRLLLTIRRLPSAGFY